MSKVSLYSNVCNSIESHFQSPVHFLYELYFVRCDV